MSAHYQHDDIARLAYWRWLERGQPQGSPEVDWYYALSVVTNPEEIRPTSIDESKNGFASQAAQGVDGESMSDDAEQADGRQASRNDSMNGDQRASSTPQSSKGTTRSRSSAGDKVSTNKPQR
jgi:hypothetical protein